PARNVDEVEAEVYGIDRLKFVLFAQIVFITVVPQRYPCRVPIAKTRDPQIKEVPVGIHPPEPFCLPLRLVCEDKATCYVGGGPNPEGEHGRFGAMNARGGEAVIEWNIALRHDGAAGEKTDQDGQEDDARDTGHRSAFPVFEFTAGKDRLRDHGVDAEGLV